MMQCDTRSIYVLKIIEIIGFGVIFRGAERASYSSILEIAA